MPSDCAHGPQTTWRKARQFVPSRGRAPDPAVTRMHPANAVNNAHRRRNCFEVRSGASCFLLRVVRVQLTLRPCSSTDRGDSFTLYGTGSTRRFRVGRPFLVRSPGLYFATLSEINIVCQPEHFFSFKI